MAALEGVVFGTVTVGVVDFVVVVFFAVVFVDFDVEDVAVDVLACGPIVAVDVVPSEFLMTTGTD